MLERRKLHMKSQETEILSRVDQEAKVRNAIIAVHFTNVMLSLFLIYLFSKVPRIYDRRGQSTCHLLAALSGTLMLFAKVKRPC